MTPTKLDEIYEKLCSIENLEQAFKKARKGKTLKPYVIKFEENLKENLQQLRNELLMQTYQPGPLKTFILRDPKTRKISKSEFRDRVIHHAICNIIEPIIDKTFIHDSYANRIGKGTLNALKRFDMFKRKVSKNNSRTCFVLKADIKHYFDTVDHLILISLLEKIISDKRTIHLIRTILENHKTEHKHKGMPLGNLTSQFFANVYLNELDQYVKHKLKAKYYIRYVDDFVILSDNKVELEEHKNKIDLFLREKLALELHPDKSKILKLENGICFLGFRSFYHHRLIRKKNVMKFNRRLQKMKRLYKKGFLPREKVIDQFEGWLAYTSNADSFKYRKRITKQFNQDFPLVEEIKETHIKKQENLSQKIDAAKMDFTQQKTLHLFRQKFTVKQIAEKRELKESTIWEHLAKLIEQHQLKLEQILSEEKIRLIMSNISSENDLLKDIKSRIKNQDISFEEINCVLASIKGRCKEKNVRHLVRWFQRNNCQRKCSYHKTQRQECKDKFQQFTANNTKLKLTTKEFIYLFNNHLHICKLPDSEKRRILHFVKFKNLKALEKQKTEAKKED